MTEHMWYQEHPTHFVGSCHSFIFENAPLPSVGFTFLVSERSSGTDFRKPLIQHTSLCIIQTNVGKHFHYHAMEKDENTVHPVPVVQTREYFIPSGQADQQLVDVYARV